MLTLNNHKIDVYKVNLQKQNDVFITEIANIISWDSIKISLTKNELKELADFIHKTINTQ